MRYPIVLAASLLLGPALAMPAEFPGSDAAGQARFSGSAALETFATFDRDGGAADAGLLAETRLVLEAKPEEGLSFRAEGGLRDTYGAASREALAFDAGLALPPDPATLPPGAELHRLLFLDQAYVRASLGRAGLSFGLVPLAWGAGYAFNPTARTAPPDFPGEGTEVAPGSPGLALDLALARGLSLAAYALATPRRASPVPELSELGADRFPAGARLQYRGEAADLSASLVREWPRAEAGATWRVGADATFFLGPATLYAEASLLLPGLGEAPGVGAWGAAEALDACAGAAWTIPFLDATLRLEAAWLGGGSEEAADYDLAGFLAGDRVLLARRYLFAMLEKEDPAYARWKAAAGTLANLDDGSAAIAVEVTASPRLALEFALFARIFVSGSGGELGGDRPLGGGEVLVPYRSAVGLRAKLAF